MTPEDELEPASGEVVQSGVGERSRHEFEATDQDELGRTISPDGASDRTKLILGPGDHVSRYVVLAEVGAGAMGVVYAAYDPELDRKIAIKVLHPARASASDPSRGRQRLLREAQALARLSHPNVVAVHDVGTHEGRVYVAMEFVEGETLGAWRERVRPEATRVLEVFEQAGRGLWAAHQAGMIHRDFKPDNVIIAHDGSVRVLDFGLARAAGEDDPEAESTVSHTRREDALISASGGSSLHEDLTRTGGIMGTPAYMAPEQHLGLETGPRSDQFSFFVALYETLEGDRPFAGDSVPALALAVTQGSLRAPPTGPGHVRRAIVRGLSPDPEDRFPSMEAALQALAPRHSGAGKNIALVAVAGTLAAAVAIVSPTQSPPPAPCDGVGDEAETLWNDEMRGAMRSAFDATELAFAGASRDAVDDALGTWSEQWRSSRREACEATQVRKEQSEELLDRRMACLDRHYASVAALVERFTHADAATVEHAIEAIDQLPDITACGDRGRLMASRPPLTGLARERSEAIEAELAALVAAFRTGDVAEAKRRAEKGVAAAEELGEPLELARAHKHQGDLWNSENEHERAADNFQKALLYADAAHDDRLRARAALQLVGVTGHDLAKPEKARQWVEHASAIVDRLGNPTDLRGDLEVQIGTTLTAEGKYDEAVERFERGIALLREAFPGDMSARTYALQRLAVAHRIKGRYDEAEALQQTLYDHHRTHFGPDHPKTATMLCSLGNTAFDHAEYETAEKRFSECLAIIARNYSDESPRYYARLNNYAAALWGLGRMEDAEAIHRRILAHNEARYGKDDLHLTPTLENLGNVLVALDRQEEAAASFRRSLRIRRSNYGLDHPKTVMSEMNLGVALFNLGKGDEALPLYEHTLEVWTKSLGDTHPDLGLVHTNIGDVYEAQGRYAAAIEHQTRALALFEPTYGKDHADLGWPLTGLGLAQLGAGKRGDARASLERALKVRKGADLPAGEAARMKFALARVAEDRARARKLAEEALADTEAKPALRAQIEAWLEKAS